jgi:dienelactone hydrolase
MKHSIILFFILAGSLSAQKKFTVEVPEGVNFKAETIVSEGAKISAEVYTPSNAGAKKLPTILMSHGWGGTAEGLRPDAILFARSGFLVVAIDYRGWGNSEGRLVLNGHMTVKDGKTTADVKEVREVVDPIDQTTDIFNALHWLQGHPQCDTKRIGLWGSSFSGGHVVYVAARDPRVKAFVSQVGSMDQRWVWKHPLLRKQMIQTANKRTRGKMGYPEPGQKYNNMKGIPIMEKLMHYAPIEDVEKISPSCAKLFIIAEKEELFDNREHAIKAHTLAKGTKKLMTIKGIKHYGIYKKKRKEAQQLALNWFLQHLR